MLMRRSNARRSYELWIATCTSLRVWALLLAGVRGGADTSFEREAKARFMDRHLNIASRLSVLGGGPAAGGESGTLRESAMCDTQVCPRLGRRDLCDISTVHKLTCELRVLPASGKHLGSAW